MNVLSGGIKYNNSKSVDGVNIRTDIYYGYIENKETFEARNLEEPDQVPTLGTVLPTSFDNVKIINDAILKLCESIARTNETIYDTKVEISVSYDNSIKLGKNYIISLFFPDKEGAVIIHCKHTFMDMLNDKSRENDLYDLEINFHANIKDVATSPDVAADRTELVNGILIEKDLISRVNQDGLEIPYKNYDEKVIEFLTALEKSSPAPVPKDEYLIQNLNKK